MVRKNICRNKGMENNLEIEIVMLIVSIISYYVVIKGKDNED